MKSETCVTLWKCTHCKKDFKYESEKRRHEQSHVPQFECKVCLKKFSFASALRRHEKQHERRDSVQCSMCSGKFKDETLLKRHIQYAHKGKFSCKKCSATLNSEIALRTHMKIHKPESERKFRCSYNSCSKTFNFIHHLKHHELTHTNNKPHVCVDCGKRFIQLHHLKIHQRVHKPDSWLQCPVLNCNKQFTNEYALKRHITIAKHKIKSRKLQRKAQKGAQNIKKEQENPSDKIDQLEYVSETFDVKTHDVEMVKQDFGIMDVASTKHSSSVNYEEFDNRIILVDEHVEIDDIDLSSSSCKATIGRCIETGATETSESCLCAQISTENKTNEFVKEVSQIKNNIVNLNLMDDLKCIEKRRNDANACESCECANICGIKEKRKENGIEYETPQLELRNDGIIKIKESFDIENIEVKQSLDKRDILKAKAIAMNNCKDAIGNCIVSGDGTIGDGCLCARMAADDQIISQEMEEITPRPNSSWS